MTTSGPLALAVATLLAWGLGGAVAFAACPRGTLEVGSVRTETANSVHIQHICRKVSEIDCVVPENQPAGWIAPSKEECEGAVRELDGLVTQRDRLQDLIDKFNGRIAALEGWSQSQAGYVKEFEEARHDALWDSGLEFLDALPVPAVVNGLNLSKSDANSLIAIYGATRVLLKSYRGATSREDVEKAKNIIGAYASFREGMIDLSGADEHTKMVLNALGQIHEVGANIVTNAAYAAPRKGESAERNLEQLLKGVVALAPLAVPAASVVGVYAAPAAGLGLAAVKGGEIVTASIALSHLNEAQSSNWDAQFYLRGKVRQLTEQVEQTNQAIQEQQYLLAKFQQSDH